MQYKFAEIADTVYFWFAANATTGAAGDGATPLYDVRLAGGAAGDAPTASGTPTLLTHANYSDGLHEIAIDTTGYAAGEYAVFCTLTISTVNPAGFCGSFKLRTAGTGALKVDVATIKTQAITCSAGVTILANVGDAAAPGQANGHLICGTNAPVTITGSGNALTLTSTGTNGNGLAATGNGTGSGVLMASGAGNANGLKVTGSGSGAGLAVTTAGGNANGIEATGAGTGDGMHLLGGTGGGADGLHAEGGTGALSRGLHAVGGPTSGAGFRADSSAGNTPGLQAVGFGSGAGMDLTGGATGPGMLTTGGGNNANADGLRAVAGGALANGIEAAEIGAPSDLGSGASLAKNLVDIEGQTDDIGTAGAGLTAIGPVTLANGAHGGAAATLALQKVTVTNSTPGDVAVGIVENGAGGTGLLISGTGTDITSATFASIISKIDAVDDYVDTEVAAILEDTGTTLDDMVDDLEGRLTAALATALQAHALGLGRGVVDAASSTTEVVFKTVNGAAASAANDFYNDRSIIFTSGALTLQATSISDYDGASKTATVPALTGVPAENVTFLIE